MLLASGISQYSTRLNSLWHRFRFIAIVMKVSFCLFAFSCAFDFDLLIVPFKEHSRLMTFTRPTCGIGVFWSVCFRSWSFCCFWYYQVYQRPPLPLQIAFRTSVKFFSPKWNISETPCMAGTTLNNCYSCRERHGSLVIVWIAFRPASISNNEADCKNFQNRRWTSSTTKHLTTEATGACMS